ncbi:hypothetical protein D3C87_233190 [compost metagenome]
MMNLKKLNNNWRKATILSACFVLAVSVLPACKKKSSSYGTEVINIEDILASGGTDTFQLRTSSVLMDTLSTANRVYGVLGAYHDPKFGILNASIYTQMSIGGRISLLSNSVFGNIDSVVLSLKYDGSFYGKLDPQTFEVYQLGEPMSLDSAYRRTSTVATMGTNLVEPSSATQTPKPTSTLVYDSDGDGDLDTVNSELRLRLNNSFGLPFITDILANHSAFESSDAFLSSNYFKGFRINVANATPAFGKGGTLNFNLANAQTKLTIYFKLANDPGTQQRVSLIVNSACADFNHVDITNSGLHIQDVLANPLNGQNLYYAQSFYAVPKIEVPYITDISPKSVVSNAVLFLPVAYQTGNDYYPTRSFQVYYKNADGTLGRLLRGVNPVTAIYDNNLKAYTVDLRFYFQNLVSRKINNTALYLIPEPSAFTSSVSRVIFNGPASPYKSKPKLVIKYTEFK